jgi:PAS domain S-box-containing protein
MSRDIRHHEKALEKSHDSLEQMVLERTTELENATDTLTQEIEERRLIEAELRANEERYRKVLETSPDPIVVYDMEGKVTFFNQAFTRVFGWSLEERVGKKMDQFVPEEAWPETNKMIGKVLSGESFSGFETQRYNKDKKIVHVSMSAAIYKDRDDRPVGSVIVLRDVTEQKKMELQLKHAQKMEAIGTLAGGIAHDFNNLLMGIQGRTSLMLINANASDPHFEHLKGIEEYIESAAGLTKQLLGFARGGKYEVTPTDINALIQKHNHMFGRTKKEINLYEKFQEDLWTVEVDQGQFEQVLMNLYINAWQAMPGGGDLYIETENQTIDDYTTELYEVKPGKYVKITLTDTGTGMDNATTLKIFDPFFTTKEMGRGTGLGLASTYGIIKNHGGFINVYS